MRAQRSIVVATAAALVLTASAAARAQSVDFVEQDLTVDVAASPLHIEVSLRVVATERVESFAILNPTIPLQSLDVGGLAVETEPDATYPDYVSWLEWPEPLEVGDEAVIRMVLEGEPRCRGAFGQGDVCVRQDDETILLPSSGAMAWTFLNLFGADAFTSTVTVRAPADHEVAAGQGAPRSVVDGEDGTRTWTFAADVPTEQLAVYSRAASRIVVDGPIPVVGVAVDQGTNLAVMQDIASAAAEVLPIHAERYGDPDLDEVHLLTFAGRTAFGGMGLYGNILLFDGILDDAFEYLRVQGVAHETAHTWWGGRASAAAYEEAPFFNEAFAEYSAWVALGRLQGDDVRTSGARMNALWYMLARPNGEDIAVLDPGAIDSDVYVFVTYHKASVVLRTLEEGAGPEAFERALSSLVERGNGGLSVDALAEEIERESGWDATATIDEWLREPGFPTLTAAADAVGATIAITVDGAFDMNLPAVVDREDGTREPVVLPLASGSQDVALPPGAAPLRVALDPRWTHVRLVEPALPGDVSLDGRIDAIDLVDVALHAGGAMPAERRVDGGYDPLYDVDGDQRVDRADLEAITTP